MIKNIKISKLGRLILGYLAFSLLVASFTYLFLTHTTPVIISKFISSTQSTRILNDMATALQTEINTEQLSSDDYISLSRWSKNYSYAQIQIKKEGELVFDSGLSQADMEAFRQSIDEPGAHEEQWKFPLSFQDGAAELHIFLFMETQFTTLINFVSFIAVTLLFICCFIYLLQRKLSYILAIGEVVQCYEGGMLAKRIHVEGTDELSMLAENINRMATALEAETANQLALQEESTALIASLSHDIRTPLTAVISYLDILRLQDMDPEKSKKYLDIIRAKAEQIKQLTNDLLDHSTIASSSFDGEFVPVDGATFVADLFEETTQLLEDGGFCPSVISLPLHDFSLHAFSLNMNYFLFRRIWDNLFSNLQKYAAPTAPIILEAEYTSHTLIIRLTNARSTEANTHAESHGIGLPNCQAMAARLGGAFQTNTTDGQFQAVLTIPAAPALQ